MAARICFAVATLYLKPRRLTWPASIHLFQIGRRPVAFAFETMLP